MYRPVKEELSREQQQDLLKKLLYQQGMCLLIYPQGSNTTLLTALAETIHTTDQTLHLKLCEKLQQDCKNLSLPKKLSYIYDDPTITEDFRKYPELVNFAKIILQLFSASTERRIKVFSLVKGGESSFYLQSRIINPGGYRQSINIAKIENKYYNIKENDIQFNKELSFQDVFKSNTQIDSEQLIQTFKPENVVSEKDEKLQKVRFQESKAGKLIEDLQVPDFVLKKAKSSIPIYHEEKHLNHQYTNQYERSSVGQTKSLRDDAQLINECGPNREDFNGYHANVVQGMPAVMTPQQYYLYYPSPYYGYKSQTYMNYPPMQMHPMSPQKTLSPQNQPTQSQNYYPPNTFPSNTQSAGQSSQNKRYTGRLKFFDQGRNYGFIIMDADESDIFVHYDDLQKAGISKQIIKTFKNQMYLQIRFSFKVMEYFGKYKKSRKAVELIIMGDTLSLLSSGYPLPE